MTSKQLVWLVTGTSSGFGLQIATAALAKGDKVIATSRSLVNLAPLKEAGAHVLELDVTSPLPVLEGIAKKSVEIYGRIDVLVNNAGYIAVGAVEESTPEETLAQFNTNVFGALNVTRAFLPYMREKKTGTIAFIGSLGGWRGCPIFPLYAGTKYAIRGISESLHEEIAPLGLRSICFEPGYFRTNFLQEGHRGSYESRIADYKPLESRGTVVYLRTMGNNRAILSKEHRLLLTSSGVKGLLKANHSLPS